MTDAAPAVLVVRAGERRVALALADLVEVVEPTVPVAVPAREPALRGLTTVRGRLVPLVHLGALLDGTSCPAALGEAAVVIAVGGRRVCLEVDAVEEVLRAAALPAAPAEALPLTTCIARVDGGWLPILDVPALGVRLADGGA
ncbi:MAG TPA: chemotaxis protein CheW [Gemmatimonadales bacterium]|jgi:chemotaxis signal transduction protein|nr:chemotaxis protein CheW [Gemmatimonadales bacterium]